MSFLMLLLIYLEILIFFDLEDFNWVDFGKYRELHRWGYFSSNTESHAALKERQRHIPLIDENI